eukprot:15438208-Alexandrium_andersonii.AAC.1
MTRSFPSSGCFRWDLPGPSTSPKRRWSGQSVAPTPGPPNGDLSAPPQGFMLDCHAPLLRYTYVDNVGVLGVQSDR